MIVLLGRILYWQNATIDGETLQTIATSRQTLTKTLSAKRGNIYDSTGDVLALSYYTDKVYINPSDIKTDNDKEIVAQGVAPILGIDSNELLVKLKESKKDF